MSKNKIIITVVMVISLAVFVYFLSGYLNIDKCLDSGGRWNYEKGICEYR
jgi:hypothetical protein